MVGPTWVNIGQPRDAPTGGRAVGIEERMVWIRARGEPSPTGVEDCLAVSDAILAMAEPMEEDHCFRSDGDGLAGGKLCL